MASITDCVVEGLKYPFNDIKKLLGFGVLCALISVLSTFMGEKSFEVFTASVRLVETSNTTLSHVPFSQLPTGDIYLIIGLSVLSFIVSLFILGYQYDIVKFSIDKKSELPGFSDILGMLIKGIKYFIVTIAYNIIPVLVFVVGIALVGDSSAFIAVSLISMLLAIIANLIMIMALNNMIAYDELKKAFDFNEIIGNISNLGWGKYVGIMLFTIVVMMIISVAVGFVMSFISLGWAAVISNQVLIISIVVAIIEGLFLDSFMGLFFNRVCGSVYRESIK